MNFFEHQDRARRQTRRLLVMFLLAVLAVVVAVDLALLLVVGFSDAEAGASPLSARAIAANRDLLVGGAVVTAAIVVIASLIRIGALRSGGGRVARDLGGTPVEADTRDPLRRRLHNVVEEMALASGVPVPEVYVLEREPGINAFAAGYSPADAAIAVTRGALEQLSRSELQGVIAHEFSHVLNGDMRLNIRLMGAVYGILVLSLIGRRVLRHARFAGRSRDRGAAAILLMAVAVTVIGYVGLFFGRWIKSAVSRQREFLADASAVQFTRDPETIGGALKKIAVHTHASFLVAEAEEVGHMLFGAGQPARLLATHPPLLERIRRVDPAFREEDLAEVVDRMQRTDRRAAEREARAEQPAAAAAGAVFDVAGVVDEIGGPGAERLVLAAALAASLPAPVRSAAQSREWAPAALLYTLASDDAGIRERQLLTVAEIMGPDLEHRVRGLLGAAPRLAAEQRLPLMEIALPALKPFPPGLLRDLLRTIDVMVRIDGEVDVFEYLLARQVARYLWEAANPHRTRMAGRRELSDLDAEMRTVLAIVAMHGHRDRAAAQAAYEAGQAVALPGDATALPEIADWVAALDEALDRLDALKPAAKEKLVQGLVRTVSADRRLAAAELELMRAVCAGIHVPVPPVAGISQSNSAA